VLLVVASRPPFATGCVFRTWLLACSRLTLSHIRIPLLPIGVLVTRFQHRRLSFHQETAVGSIMLQSSDFYVPTEVDDGLTAIVNVASLDVNIQVCNCSFEELGNQEYNAFSCPPCGRDTHCTSVVFGSKQPSTFYGISIANEGTCDTDCSHG
jgi:hypothetical protein